LQALSFPKFDLLFLGFVFLIPLFHGLEGQNVRNAFWFFFRFSFLSYLLILYWIPNVMVYYGGMDRTVSILGIVILAAFLAVFTGAAGSFIKGALKKGNLSLLLIPVIWVTKELIVEKIFGGFPWCSAGYSQYKNIYFVQVAEFGGVHLVTFLVIFFNVLIYLLIRKRDKRLLAVLAICAVGVYTTGYFLYRSNGNQIRDLEYHTAGILQPNTRNDQRFNWKEKNEKLEEFFNDSKALMARGAEFVIWPEFTVSVYPLQSEVHYRMFESFVEENVPVMAGFTDMQGSKAIYNSLMFFSRGRFQKYDKIHLTPFGEYILFREILFFVKRITDEIADFTPGEAVRNLEWDGHLLSTPICYELIFPELTREFIAKGGEVLIITSNDSWYGDTSAPYQLLAMSTLRTIENRRYILRSTTNGISAVIGPSGEILYRSPFNAKDVFTAKFQYIKHRTVFTRFGYLFPYACVIFFLVYFIRQKFFGRRKASSLRG